MVDTTLRAALRKQIADDCLEGVQTFAGGYAYFRINGKPVYAHKAIYESAYGPAPIGFEIYKICSNKACVEPSHVDLRVDSHLPIPRLEAKTVVLDNGCWQWTGQKIYTGYGLINWKGDQWLVHRLSYTLLVGPIPTGLEIDHTCHSNDKSCEGGWSCPHRLCVNPDHLEPVTPMENNRRGRGNRSSRKTHCPQGHPYSGSNLYIDPRGGRGCFACRREHSRKHNKKVSNGR